MEIKTSTSTHKIYYDNQALRRLEDFTGVAFMSLKYESLKEMTQLLWAGLLRHQPEATLETADSIIDDLGYESVMEIVVKAVEQSPPFRLKKGPT